MAMCNIPSTNTDPQYRYKMPRIITKVEGRGIGLRTRVVNMSEVARALYRPPQYIMKWFCTELAAGSTCGDGWIIKGAHDSHILQSSLDKFIEKYVLCRNCNLPEIDLRFKHDTLSAKCKACGWSGELDNCHKISAFLVKNPIDCHGNIVKKEKKASKREEHGGKHDKEKKESKDKEDRTGKKGNTDKKAKADSSSKDREHSKGSSDAAQDGDVEFDDDKITSTITSLTEFIESKHGFPTPDDFFAEVRVLQLTKAFDHKIRLYVVLRVVFQCSMDAKGLADQSKLLDKFIANCLLETKDILWAFNKYFDASKNDLDIRRCFPLVLKVLYDEEWCTEEGILAYYNNDEGAGEPGFVKAKATAKPFLTWLAQDVAESDSDSSA